MVIIDNFKDASGELGLEEIKKIIPYKEPFLFVDRVITLEKGRIIAIKNIEEDIFFKCHFVDFPIMPGTLMVEGIGQAATLLVRYNVTNQEEKDVVVYEIKEAKFKEPIFPGMQIRYDVALLALDEKRATVQGRIYSRRTKDTFIAEALLVLVIVNKHEFRKIRKSQNDNKVGMR